LNRSTRWVSVKIWDGSNQVIDSFCCLLMGGMLPPPSRHFGDPPRSSWRPVLDTGPVLRVDRLLAAAASRRAEPRSTTSV
jgi:hypothetical protein